MTPPFAPGEPLVCVDDSRTADGFKPFMAMGIYIVKSSGAGGSALPTGGKSRVEWVDILGIDPHITATHGFYRASRFRPLHGTDIRRLETKYPEYIIKTNEVEG